MKASGVNISTYHEPFRLCEFHHDVYMSVRQLEPCSKHDCHYGYPSNKGKGKVCSLHSNSNERLTSQVSFMDTLKKDTTDEPQPQMLGFYDGLKTMSPTLVKQAIGECFDLGLKRELEIAKKTSHFH